MNYDRHYNRDEHINNTGGCYFHRKQVFVGVCPLCLNEKLLILATKQAGCSHGHLRRNQGFRKSYVTSFPRIFSFGSYFFNRIDIRNWKTQDSDHDCGSSSQDESFISIKLEENGVASWEQGKDTVEHCNMPTWNHSLRKETPKRRIEHFKETKSVIEIANKSRVFLRWRKRIGHLFHLIRLKRSTKVEGVKVRSWIRTFTKRKTKDL